MRSMIAVLGLLLLTACGRGYISENDLERGEIGPSQCTARCADMGMRMGAFVMVNHGYAGCVCTPAPSSGGSSPGHAVAEGSAAQMGAVIAMTELAQQQQRQRQQQQQQQ
ncbi:MAG: hypothetical protein AB8I08_33840 [Sandaracinaceae bacterium]